MASLIQSWWRGWSKINFPWKEMHFKGTDSRGNLYFESVSLTGQGRRKRMVQLATGPSTLSQYNPDAIPLLWQSWLRHTRAQLPTLQEEAAVEESRLAVLIRADELDRKRGEGKYASIVSRMDNALLIAAKKESAAPDSLSGSASVTRSTNPTTSRT